MMLQKIVILCCVALSCNHASDKKQGLSNLYQHWTHSFEEDDNKQHYLAFRPSTFSFPPARGRDGFEIRKNGTVISYAISPSDGNTLIEGKWILNKEELSIIAKGETVKYKVISLHKDKMMLQLVK